MSIKKTLVKNSVFNLLGYIYLLIAAFISVPILLKNFGLETFGTYIILNSLIPLAASVDFGLSQATIRRLSLPSATDQEKLHIWQTGLFLYLFTGVLITLLFVPVYIMLSARFSIISSPLVGLFILSIIFVNHLTSLLLTLPQADQRFDIYNLRSMLSGTGNTLISAFVVYFSPRLESVFLAQLIFYLLTAMSLVSYARRKFTLVAFLPRTNREISKNLLNFGARNFVGNIANQLNLQVSKYLLGGLISATAVTIFSLPQTLIMKAAGGISQLTIALFPLSASLSSKEKIGKLRQLVIASQLFVFIIGILGVIATYAFGKQFLVFWLKDIQIASNTFPVLQILSWFLLINILTPIPSAVLDSLNYPQVTSASAVLTSVINIALLYFLVPIHQSIGAAYAALWSSLITTPLFLLSFAYLFRRYQCKLAQS